MALARVRIIDKECVTMEPHPDLVKYVPDMPRETLVCTVTAGITGESIGRLEWGHIGTITYNYMPREGIGYIEFINVWDEFRRKGYGELLVNKALERMKENNVRSVYTAPVKKGSPEFFATLNFQPLAGTPLFYKYI